jgi:hypothetical protein
MKIRLVGAEFFQTYGQTDMTKPIFDSEILPTHLKYWSGSLIRLITCVYCILYIPEQEHAYEMRVIEAERHFLSYASTIQKNFHQQCIGLLGNARGSLALVLPLTIMHLCGQTLFYLVLVPCRRTRLMSEQYSFLPIPLASRSKAWVYSLPGNAVSNPALGMELCLL